jgi:hypothetical protein
MSISIANKPQAFDLDFTDDEITDGRTLSLPLEGVTA